MSLCFLLLAAVPETNVLSLEAGTLLVQSSASFGGVWNPEALTDADPATGWCNTAGSKGPFTFVYELEQRSALTSLVVNNANAEEPTNPGVSANGLEVWTSSTSSTEGFTRAATLTLKKSGSGRAAMPKDTAARWVRLVVLGRSTEPAPDERKRCERRAQRLLAHLQKAGVPTSAVDVGFGILKMGAAVQLEPRVEAMILP